MFSLKKISCVLALVCPLSSFALPNSNTGRMDAEAIASATAKAELRRASFKQAAAAMKAGDVDTARSIEKASLQGYPLNVWLDYWYLSVNPSAAKFNAVQKFISSGKQHELGEILKNKYVKVMADAGEFAKVLKLIGGKPFDDNQNLSRSQQSLQCRFYEAKWRTGTGDASGAAFAGKIYQQLNGYPEGCYGLLSLWQGKGYLTLKVLEEKFEKAYVSKAYSQTVSSLARQLYTTNLVDRTRSQMELYDAPERVLEMSPDGSDDDHRTAVLAFKRFANLNPGQAAASLDNFSITFEPSEAERIDIIKLISNSFLGRLKSKEDVAWVDRNLPSVGWTDALKEQRLRKAIWFGQWDVVYALVDYLPPESRKDINWQYWKAKSAIKLGKNEEGSRLMSKVAKDRSFFGFLAAQELGLDLPFNHKKLPSNVKWPNTVENDPAVQRFFEFVAMGDSNAGIEWREIAKYSKEDVSLTMAEWALQSGNISYAIQSVVAGGRWDALNYRFPYPYLDLYTKYSKTHNVPISFLYGISRQESMMNPVVRSPVGAVGLMQLMPGTASMVSRQNNWSYQGTRDLLVPENNIRLGSAYLRDMLNKFDGNRVLAAAAYNAGPGRIGIWKSKDGMKRDVAMYIENIPFKETRKYVQNVLLYDVIYSKLLTGREGKLLKRSEITYNY